MAAPFTAVASAIGVWRHYLASIAFGWTGLGPKVQFPALNYSTTAPGLLELETEGGPVQVCLAIIVFRSHIRDGFFIGSHSPAVPRLHWSNIRGP